MLTRMAPGVQVPGTTQFLVQGQVGGGSQYNSPGGVGGNEWSMDGASTNGTDRRVSFMPSPDVVDEFKIETSNFDAAFGHSTGLNITMSTKSGANAFHGSATYQYFNQRWNAASFFVKQARYQQIAVARAANNLALADAAGGAHEQLSRHGEWSGADPEADGCAEQTVFLSGLLGAQESTGGAAERDQLHGADGGDAGGGFLETAAGGCGAVSGL